MKNNIKTEAGESKVTLAGQKGNPLTFARTRSPRLNWLLQLALFAPRLRGGAIACTPQNVKPTH